jgi:hypothetical protein
MTDIKYNTAMLLSEEFNIPRDITEELFDIGILNVQNCRNVLIQREYKRKACSKERNRIKTMLSDKYCVSFPTVEKILHNNG